MMRESIVKNAAVLGLALFAMFFGAGNLIFPPVIGLEGGTDWFWGFLAYFVADVGLALVSIIAMIKADGDMGKVTGSAGRVPSIILNTVIIACIGPLLAIPRCAATSFEMITTAVFGGCDNWIATAVFSVVFFAIVYAAVMNPGKVVGYIGKILTPVLVVVLAVLIIVGVANPAAGAAPASIGNLLEEGVANGYQTMDMLAALAFSIIAVQTVKGFGYSSVAKENKTVFAASGIAAVLLMLVYGGLAFLGATTGQLWAAGFADGSVGQASLLANMSGAVLGNAGKAILSVIVLLACLTTAIGLVSSCSEYFWGLCAEKVSYRSISVVICVFAAVLCNIGLAQIISVSAPILTLVYPVALFLVVASLVRKGCENVSIACMLGAGVTLLVSLATVLADTFGMQALDAIHNLPLDSLGFNWLVPALVATLIGFAIERMVVTGHAQG